MIVKITSADDAESFMAIKADGLFILLVDIYRRNAQFGYNVQE